MQMANGQMGMSALECISHCASKHVYEIQYNLTMLIFNLFLIENMSSTDNV